MSNPKILLNIYKEETEKILEAVEEENLDVIDEMFNKRQEIIEELKKYDLKVYKKEFSDNIVPLEKKLKIVMEEKKQYFKEELFKIRKQKTANKAYNNGNFNSIFNKKV
ncbi:flagellar protein FliT [Clostridium frigidicarnis]|uniref:Flagellar protein FliT n=1 Tax=Clostridium frigidicarnis TaxID=84698 RepID=A0A1I0VEQ0_9CLOT|nr:flagellar protein FliT [Clostridium frigidicarnis]SFA74493.1 protein FliT [Clostridium frigidicarnis]